MTSCHLYRGLMFYTIGIDSENHREHTNTCVEKLSLFKNVLSVIRCGYRRYLVLK
jgi:hypothetical protein